MSQTAMDEFQEATARLTGPVERDLAEGLLGRVNVVADDPSARFSSLAESRKIGANDKKIFGTADKMGLQMFTGDANFLRGAAAQGVELSDAIVHPSVSFRGR